MYKRSKYIFPIRYRYFLTPEACIIEKSPVKKIIDIETIFYFIRQLIVSKNELILQIININKLHF